MADMSLSEAISVTRNFAKFLKGMERLKEAADALEPAEQMVSAKKAELASLESQIVNAREQIDGLGEVHSKLEAEAKAAAEKILTDAKAKAVEIEKAAQGVVEAAKAEAAKVMAEAEQKRDAARAAAAAAKEELKATRDRLASLATDVRGMVAGAVGA